jgi:hypothetical protein
VKKAAMISLAAVLICGALLIYALVGTRLVIEPHPPRVLPASEHAAEFERLKKAAAQKSLVGTLYAQNVPGGAADYELVIYTVTLRNRGLLPARMAEMNISPAQNDILCYTDGSAEGQVPEVTVPAGGSRDIRCVLLSKKAARQGAVRDTYISYYIWGNPFTVRATVGY